MYTEDGHFIQKCLDGEPAAFGFLVDKYRSCVYSLAYAKLGNFHDAEDIAQEVFIKAYQKLHALKRSDKFRPWLYAITSNLCTDFLRSRSSRPESAYLEDVDEAILEEPSMEAYQNQLRRKVIHAALKELPEIYRQVLTLYYLGGMNNREIAEFLGTSKNTIESRLKRARAKLKTEVIPMMTTTFDEMRLQPGFTFRVVEAVKRTRIPTNPTKPALPVGVSAAVGLIALMLSLTIPQSPLYPIGELIGSALPSRTQVPEGGVIPVDTVEVTKITILSSERGAGDFGQKPKPDEPIKAFGAGKWEWKADLPERISGMSSSVVNGKIFIIGGTDRESNNRSTVYEYDPVADKTVRKADMQVGRAHHSTHVVDGQIYVVGGIIDINNDFKAWKGTPTVEVYDPVADVWGQVADLPTLRFVHNNACAVDGKIYVIGGMGFLNDIWKINDPMHTVATVEVYDSATNKWSRVVDMPTARGGLVAVPVDGKIYAIGGAIAENRIVQQLPIVEMYDPATDQWTRLNDMPISTNNMSASVVNDKIYVVGGVNFRAGNQFVSVAHVQMYDPKTDQWTPQASMLTPRHNLDTSVVDGKIYAIGGYSNRNLESIEVFDPEFEPPQSVDPGGKLTTTWGEAKADN